MKTTTKRFILKCAVVATPVLSVAHATDDGLGGASSGIAGMGTVVVAGVAAVVTGGIALKVIPMGIRFLGRVWNAIIR